MINTIITIISIIATIISVVGAIKSIKSFKKTKLLIGFANQNIAFVEIKLIEEYALELLKIHGQIVKRGVNKHKKIASIGEELYKSITKIKNSLSVAENAMLNDILVSETFDTNGFINSLIEYQIRYAEIDVDFNEKFRLFQDVTNKTNNYIKSLIEKTEEILK